MALLAASTIEVRPGAGADTNGGGASNAAATNLSMQNAAAYTCTDLVTAGTTTVTSATANWGTDVADNWMYITGGTGAIAANWYRIVTRTSASSLVLDRSTGLTTGTGATSNTGGALATIGGAGALLAANAVNGMVMWVKAGTNTLTSSSANVSGGVFTTALTGLLIVGYDSTRGDLNGSIGSASRPVIDCGAITTITVIAHTANGGRLRVANIKVDGKGNASVIGFGLLGPINCTAVNCTTGFTWAGVGTAAVFCSAVACGTGFTSGTAMTFVYCFTNDCTTVGFAASAGWITLVGCVSINDAISSTLVAVHGLTVINCTFHEPTGDAISGTLTCAGFINSLFTSAGADAIDFGNATDAPTTAYVLNCAFHNNGTVYETTPPTANISGSITLTGDPYTSEATDDLSPNNTAGAGASLRNAGIDVFGQTDNRDVGAVQHADPAGGATGGFVIGS